MMNIEDVFRKLSEIADVVGDYEAAHSREDDLYYDLLKAIAAGECDDPEACARVAISSKHLDFPRYCA